MKRTNEFFTRIDRAAREAYRSVFYVIAAWEKECANIALWKLSSFDYLVMSIFGTTCAKSVLEEVVSIVFCMCTRAVTVECKMQGMWTDVAKHALGPGYRNSILIF